MVQLLLEQQAANSTQTNCEVPDVRFFSSYSLFSLCLLNADFVSRVDRLGRGFTVA